MIRFLRLGNGIFRRSSNYYQILRVSSKASYEEIDSAFIERIVDPENIVQNKTSQEIDIINGRSVRDYKEPPLSIRNHKKNHAFFGSETTKFGR